MALIVDTGVLYAWYDRDDRWHEPVRTLLELERGALILPTAILAEVDHLLGRALGFEAQLAFYEDLAAPVYVVADLEQAGYRRVAELNTTYRSLHLGLVDAAVMATAEQLGVDRIATTDRRDFGAVTLRMPIDLLPT